MPAVGAMSWSCPQYKRHVCWKLANTCAHISTVNLCPHPSAGLNDRVTLTDSKEMHFRLHPYPLKLFLPTAHKYAESFKVSNFHTVQER